MAQKQLEPHSEYSKFDKNNDGVVSDEELELSRQLEELKLSSEKADAQRGMAWFALWGMLLYPSLVVGSEYLGLSQASSILGSMAAVYFASVAAIVAAFFSAQAWASRR